MQNYTNVYCAAAAARFVPRTEIKIRLFCSFSKGEEKKHIKFNLLPKLNKTKLFSARGDKKCSEGVRENKSGGMQLYELWVNRGWSQARKS